MERSVIAVAACCAILLSAGCGTRAASGESGATKTNPVPAGIDVVSRRPFLLTEIDRSRAAAVFFIGTDCPISNAYAPEIKRIIATYEPRGVAFYLVYAVRELEPQAAAEHARSFESAGRLIVDPQLELARALGAERMPEAVLLSPQGEAIYQGRIDDRYPVPGGKRREHPTTRDLRDALDAFLAGKPITTPRTAAVGCPLDFPER